MTHTELSGTQPEPDAGPAVGTPVAYDGVWERKGYSPLAAAYIVLFGIGALYFTASNIFSIPIGFMSGIFGSTSGEDMTYVERISHVFRQLALPIQILLVVMQFGFLLAPTLLLTKKLHTSRVKEYLRIRPVPVIDVVLAVIITAVMIPFTNFFATEIMKWFDIPDWLANLGNELFTAHSLPEFIWLVFVIGITPAICEEALFRGYAQRTLERRNGAKSIWIVGIIFGLYHFSPLGLISLAIMGVVFGFFFYRSKSLFPSMAAHFTNNTIVVYILYAGLEIGGVNVAEMTEFPLWLVGASAAVSGILLYGYYLLTRGRSDPFPDDEPAAETTQHPSIETAP